MEQKLSQLRAMQIEKKVRTLISTTGLIKKCRELAAAAGDVSHITDPEVRRKHLSHIDDQIATYQSVNGRLKIEYAVRISQMQIFQESIKVTLDGALIFQVKPATEATPVNFNITDGKIGYEIVSCLEGIDGVIDKELAANHPLFIDDENLYSGFTGIANMRSPYLSKRARTKEAYAFLSKLRRHVEATDIIGKCMDVAQAGESTSTTDQNSFVIEQEGIKVTYVLGRGLSYVHISPENSTNEKLSDAMFRAVLTREPKPHLLITRGTDKFELQAFRDTELGNTKWERTLTELHQLATTPMPNPNEFLSYFNIGMSPRALKYSPEKKT